MAKIVGKTVKMATEPDESPDVSWLDPYEDAERLASYYRGDWCMVGIYAKCDILIPWCPGNAGGIVQSLRTPGLWGVESDSSEEYMDDIRREELRILRGMVVDLGIDPAPIDEALRLMRADNDG